MVGSTTNYQLECSVSSDQSKTFKGSWSVVPVPIALKSGDFTESEAAAVMAAADSWNQFFTQSRGYPLFSYGTWSNPNLSTETKPTSACSKGLISGGAFVGKVVLYKQATGWTNGASVIALTTQCVTSGSSLGKFSSAFIELNYQDFFVSGKKVPDLQSIILHELGHLMGLDHSCESGSTTTGIPDCASLSSSHNYFNAIMYPSIFFPNGTSGELRRSLQSNDQGRANCLYEKSSSL